MQVDPISPNRAANHRPRNRKLRKNLHGFSGVPGGNTLKCKEVGAEGQTGGGVRTGRDGICTCRDSKHLFAGPETTVREWVANRAGAKVMLKPRD